MFKKQLEDLSLNNQPLMDKFVTVKPKLERVPLPTPTHRNPFDDPGVRRESVKKPTSPERSKSASVRSRSASVPVHKSMTYLQKLTICRMDEQYLRPRVITWAIEKYGSGNSTIRKVLMRAPPITRSSSTLDTETSVAKLRERAMLKEWRSRTRSCASSMRTTVGSQRRWSWKSSE